MADYFTYFSIIFTLPNPEAQSYALQLAKQAGCIRQGDEAPGDFPKELAAVIENWSFETEADIYGDRPAIWLHSSYGGMDAVCAFLQHLLLRFDPQGRVTFEWSHDCSKPRTDVYGGGAAIVTATEIKTMSTCQWLNQHTA